MRAMGMNPTENELLELINEVSHLQLSWPLHALQMKGQLESNINAGSPHGSHLCTPRNETVISKSEL
jgi:hypothetical protein